MRRGSSLRMGAAAAGFLILGASLIGTGTASAKVVMVSNADNQKWLTSLNDGYAEARKENRPILVRAGATWCGWCRKLDQEIKKPVVQKALSGYVLVYLDIDDDTQDARSLGIDAVPALRVLTPTGRVAASKDGYLEADELAKWLNKERSKAAVAVPSHLVSDQPPSGKDVEELVGELRGREPLYREAAIQRLMPYPDVSAPAVAKLFAEGGLSERLAALELLSGWKAPIQDLDPWQPETLTPERLEALRTWAKKASEATAPAPSELVGEALETAYRELARLVQVERDSEAEVVRERLARRGPALLPIVVEELKNAPKDRDRERLTALRYRLVAPDRLAMEWPSGFERLASMNAETRQQAAEELAKRAQADSAPLLRELFSNPDPLVREISLRALRKVGGEEANETLAMLLNDPEPNVRAAVLKELAEQPSRKMIPKLAEYVAGEKDADLMVHAARVLRAAGGKAALDALISMTGHDTWQVRAEVAESIGEVLNQSGDLPQASRADAYVALIGMLKDTDGFVVSRAMTSLQHADVSLVIKPLVEATEEHPELAGALIEMLAQRGSNSDEVRKYLRQLCKAKHASVRAAAIAQLCESAPMQSDEELLAAFGDPEEDVRFGAAKGFLAVLDAYRPSARPADASAYIIESSQSSSAIIRLLTGNSSRVRASSHPDDSASSTSQPADEDNWLNRFRAGSGRPKWMEQVVAPLQALLASQQPERRLTAAVGLIALAHDEIALTALREVVHGQPSIVGQAARALRWLPLEPRLALFQELLDLSADSQPMADVISGLAAEPDIRAAVPLWDLLARKDLAPGWANTIQTSLRRLYFGQEYSRPNLKDSQRRDLVAALRPWAEKGPELRKIVAMSLLLVCSPSDAATVGKELYESPKSSKALKADALQVMLLGEGRDEASKMAAAALSSVDDEVRSVALLYLARGRTSLGSLRGSVSLQVSELSPVFDELASGGSPIIPQAPPGLKVEDVRPLLSSTDKVTRAHAGYLLALLKQADGLAPLRDYWQQNARNDWGWRREVYRAVSALNDDSLTPLLEEMYTDLSQETWQLRDFYWTIRSMDGEKVLALRKKIRTEVGMDRLK